MSTTIFMYAVCLAVLSNLLSVSAIRCHECNSHEDEDCASLVVNTPRAQRDDQFLKECNIKDGQVPFCRKTVIKFEVNDNQRIVRNCGWIPEKVQNACFTADNEGYKQVVCTCNGDGCNGASALLGARQVGYSLIATVVSLAMAAVLRN
ncbi:UPAR/Ly6 domain-containing protein crok [Drosophila bipectinata]|uniref:UPAR/Ly6 domain-containing protein crok n=1 Tax=Drosophila bipectinata TaxID=42026 RepID=UPI001C892323|nr:uncharacterized protein LOC108126105 [Drosophila bipectinata]XP_017098039.2 uncharacterized protein LOC108126105 [Drosophila bipectinata]